MSDFDPNNPSDFEGDERGDLAWNEFDWEHYLREQDDVVLRYVAFYETLNQHPDRLAEVAVAMGWDRELWASDSDTDEEDDDSLNPDEWEAGPYTFHKNYIYISTKAIYLTLKRGWEAIADRADRVPQRTALAYQTALHRGEEQAVLAIQALDFGDYAMAISLFKRALAELNQTLTTLNADGENVSRTLARYRAEATSRLFDLREIWLRMMRECRQILERPIDADADDSDDDGADEAQE
ncbi:hypothetical protein OH491_07725 [Termitidicoccus mucosus]|uniref:Uncharacterized protein n=1 Tax=Termitidicoccus mucosus TaxID=1184151 RepID=A0A178IEJ8_9BACT|nr:hypothetical protein AW736_21335 [Opitutaceae bacterium TSB47]